MPFVEKRLISPTSLTTSASTALYTVPAGYTAIVKQIVVTNTTGTAATFTMYIGAASAGNALFSGTSVAANDTVIINLSQVLGTGEILRALSGTNAALNLTVSGVENDGPLAQNAMYIADNAITTAKVADGSITTAKIADGSIVTVDIAANAVTQDKLSTDIPLSGFRNAIINGGFDIWQRGTAVQTNAGQGAYAADRWCGAHQYQNSRTQRTSISSPPSGLVSQYALRSSSLTTAQSANGSRMRIAQKLESLNSYKLRGQQVTLSFWVRFSNATVSSISNAGGGGSSAYGNFGYSIGSYTSTTDSATNTSAADAATNATITNGSLPTTWTKYTLAGTISSTANNVDVVFGFSLLGSTTSADTEWFEIAQVQLETGSQATPFEQRPYGVELQLCQRYYYRTGGGVASDIYLAGYQPASTNIIFTYFHPVTMRATPSLASKVGTWLLINSASQPIIGGASAQSYYAYITVNAGITNANQSGAYTNNSTTYFEFSSEL